MSNLDNLRVILGGLFFGFVFARRMRRYELFVLTLAQKLLITILNSFIYYLAFLVSLG